MAVTKIWPVKGRIEQPIAYAINPKKTDNTLWAGDASIEDVIDYASNNEKTEKQYYVSGINCEPESAAEEFRMVKKQFQKQGGITCYHGYQSFAEGEVTPKEAHAIGVELAKKFWGKEYQVIVTTHLNTKCLHNHFVINSVSFVHGRRCRQTKWRELKTVSDEICRQHQKSVIETSIGKGMPYTIAKAEENGKASRLNLARAALDEALSQCGNLKELQRQLKAQGYELDANPSHKYWTIRQANWNRPIRLIRMGKTYEKEAILQKLIENQSKQRLGMKNLQAERRYCRQKVKTPKRKVSGLRGRYLHYCHRLGAFQKRQSPGRVHYLYRDELLKLNNITAEARLLCTNRIESAEELFAYEKKLESEVKDLCVERKKLYNEKRRAGLTAEEKERIAREREALTAEIRACRRKLHLCENIQMRSEHLKEAMKQEQEMRENMKNKKRETERGQGR